MNIVDSVTAEVVFSARGAGEYELSNREVLGFGGTAGYDSTLNGKVLDLAMREAVSNLVTARDAGAGGRRCAGEQRATQAPPRRRGRHRLAGRVCPQAAPPLYLWERFPRQHYDALLASGVAQSGQIEALEAHAEKARATGTALPPGFRADPA